MGSKPSKKPPRTPELTIKLLIMGDPGVGKTSLINKYIYNEFPVTESDYM
jgi:GTPase SAR1 family protein